MLLNLLKAALRRAPSAEPVEAVAGDPLAVLERAEQRLAIEPTNPACHYEAGLAALLLGRLPRARAALERTVELQPSSFDAHIALGAILQQMCLPAEALRHYTSAARIRPDDAAAHGYVGNMQLQLGRQADAVAAYRAALDLEPDNDALHSNLLLALNSLPGIGREQLYEAHRAFGFRLEERHPSGQPAQPRRPDPDRPLRVGYVSADFRAHSVAHFIEPIWSRINRGRYATLVYDNNADAPDSVSNRLQRYADRWTRTAAMSDDQLDAAIRTDEVDILVDLSGHTAGNRLPVFARQPAPVQVTWFAYMNTTGLRSMHYRLTDHWLAPAGEDRFYTETLVRLPAAAAWSPDPTCPPVNDLPALRTGTVTFGSFNNWTKVSGEVVGAWAAVLAAVPQSRILLVVKGAEDPARRIEVANAFARYGVDGARLDIRPTLPLTQFLRLFQDVDVALDSFPYTGGTTTLYSLWMGVPVVSIESAGETGRTSAGLLLAVGTEELLAGDVAGYVGAAVRLAGDLERLAGLRTSLRTRLLRSGVMQSESVTLSVERAFAAMWRARLKGEREPLAF
jgi:protein O-GlcNAc transferase